MFYSTPASVESPVTHATRVCRFHRDLLQEHHQQRRRSALGCSPCYHPAIIARCHPRTGVVVRHLVPRRWWQLPPLRPPPLPAWWPCRTAKTSLPSLIRYRFLFPIYLSGTATDASSRPPFFASKLIYSKRTTVYIPCIIRVLFVDRRCRANMEYPTKRTTQGTPKEDQWPEWGQSG